MNPLITDKQYQEVKIKVAHLMIADGRGISDQEQVNMLASTVLKLQYLYGDIADDTMIKTVVNTILSLTKGERP